MGKTFKFNKEQDWDYRNFRKFKQQHKQKNRNKQVWDKLVWEKNERYEV